jgi:hypothetical protein
MVYSGLTRQCTHLMDAATTSDGASTAEEKSTR